MRYNRRVKPIKDITIIQDDREKQPWSFLTKYYKVKIARLAVGDYSIEGYEDKIAIEKKSGIMEVLGNLVAGNRPRFERMLERLSKYPVKTLVVCEPLSGSLIRFYLTILKRKSRCQLTEESFYYWLARTGIGLNIPVLLCNKPDVEHVVIKMIEQCRTRLNQL
jgi:ERCC4-type nuclease